MGTDVLLNVKPGTLILERRAGRMPQSSRCTANRVRMGSVTVSRPPESPQSRRAARALREEAERRAHAESIAANEPPRTTLPLPIQSIATVAAGATEPARAPEPAAPDAAAPEPARTRTSACRAAADPSRCARGAAAQRRCGARAPCAATPAARAAVAISLAAAGALLLGSSAAVTAMMTDAGTGDSAAAAARFAPPPLQYASALPVPTVAAAEATQDICALPEVSEALAAGDDDGTIAAAGGGEAFRDAVVERSRAMHLTGGSCAHLGRHRQDASVQSGRLSPRDARAA